MSGIRSITVWLLVRVLPGPPRTLSKREIFPSLEKTGGSAAFSAVAQSPETALAIHNAFWGLFSLVNKSRFPESRDAVTETGSTEFLSSGEGEQLALA